ncbi:MAG: biotin transporter BioY [Ruminococcus sp.]|nr:biotin transporter BioY [Ruminococcus sp.]
MNQALKFSVKNICIAAVLTALCCVLAPMSIPIGPVPISLGTFCIFLTAAILPWNLSFMSSLVYILIGAVGLPVFSGFKGGFQVLAGPTGGYIVAYPIMAIIVSLITRSFIKKGAAYHIVAMVVSMIIALAFCYLLGTIWFVISMGTTFGYALSVCVIPFIAVDLIKIAAATILGFSVTKALSKAGLFY